jgi:membrane fusion protein, multidrug efflux system
MNSQDDKTSRIERAAEQARREYQRAVQEPGGWIIGGVRAWSARRLPGGEVTLWVTLGVVLLVLAAWALLPGTGGRMGMFGGGQRESEAQPVAVAVAKKGEIKIVLSALGTVTPLATATVTPQASGQVMRIGFSEGQMVRQGDVLAQIDPRNYQASYDEAAGSLAKDKASLANAETAWKRQKALFKAQATSKSDLDSAEAAYRQYLGAVRADQASLASAQIKLDFTKVTAPISGRIGLRGVDVGNYVSSGQTTGIAVITQVNPMSVLFAIPEDSVDSVARRINSGAVLTVEVYDRAMTKKISEGELSAIDSQISTTTGTVKLRAMFDNEDGVLFPNQFVNVKLLVDTLQGQTVIPVTAIQRGSSGTFVFVVGPDKTVSMRAVTLGAQDVDVVAVTKGLNPGETVVTDGADRLSDGASVTIPSGKEIAKVEAAVSAGPTDARNARRALFRKLKPEEREALHKMSKPERDKWMDAHKAELMKRPNQPRPPGGGRGPGGPPPM